MIFAIGVIAYLVGRIMFRFCYCPFERTAGATIGVVLMLAGVAMALVSCLILAWSYLP